MTNYEALERHLRTAQNAKVLILDTGNIQFYFQNEALLPKSHIFNRYDLVLIPSWVQSEYVHHSGKVAYMDSIPVPCVILNEVEDYLPLVDERDTKLMELLRFASPLQESIRFFNQLRKVEVDEWPDDWIQQYYDNGFPSRETETRITKKNAGEASALTLCFLLLSHYPTQISNITIASSDFGIIKIREKMAIEANKPPLNLGIAIPPKISYMSKDVSMFIAVKEGILDCDHIPGLRRNDRSAIYVEQFSDGTSSIYQHVLTTAEFEGICRNHQRYTLIF